MTRRKVIVPGSRLIDIIRQLLTDKQKKPAGTIFSSSRLLDIGQVQPLNTTY